MVWDNYDGVRKIIGFCGILGTTYAQDENIRTTVGLLKTFAWGLEEGEKIKSVYVLVFKKLGWFITNKDDQNKEKGQEQPWVISF